MGLCTISQWGIGWLLAWNTSYVQSGGEFLPKLATCDGNATGLVVINEHEVELCTEACTAFLDTGSLTVDVIGLCD